MREFATQRSLKKHGEKTGHINKEADIQFFNQCGTESVILPVPKEIVPSQQAAYKEFLVGVAELTNSFLRPDVKSKWVKIDLIMVPTAYFQHVLSSLGINKPFSVRESRHPSPLKKESSIALFYNVYDLSILRALFDTAAVSLKSKVYFRHHEEVSAPVSELTAKEKVALARQRAGTRWGADNVNSVKPTTRRQLKCEEGDWPRTREFQLIWWPHVFSQSNFGHMRLRFYVEHVELTN